MIRRVKYSHTVNIVFINLARYCDLTVFVTVPCPSHFSNHRSYNLNWKPVEDFKTEAVTVHYATKKRIYQPMSCHTTLGSSKVSSIHFSNSLNLFLNLCERPIPSTLAPPPLVYRPILNIIHSPVWVRYMNAIFFALP